MGKIVVDRLGEVSSVTGKILSSTLGIELGN